MKTAMLGLVIILCSFSSIAHAQITLGETGVWDPSMGYGNAIEAVEVSGPGAPLPFGEPDYNDVEPDSLVLARFDQNGITVLENDPVQTMGAGADTCQTATPGLFGFIHENVLPGSDVDWYMGLYPGTGLVTAVMVPPANKNYDVQIYDSCSGQPLNTCFAGTGAIEECQATVTSDFYVKIYPVGGPGDAVAPYHTMAFFYGTCWASMNSGTAVNATSCTASVGETNAQLRSTSTSTVSHFLFSDLYTPSNQFVRQLSKGSITVPGNQTHSFSSTFTAPPGGWTESGNYKLRDFTIAYCTDTFTIKGLYTTINPTVNCFQCTNECSMGSHRCQGSYSQTCGNYDSDSCTEWGNDLFCSNGCNTSTGLCYDCVSHSYSQCVGNDRYWFNSCNQQQEMRQDCGDNSTGSNYCFDNDVYHDVTIRGCSGDQCTANSSSQKVSECGAAGCANGACLSCISHNDQVCQNGDLYWVNSCNELEDIAQDCRITCQDYYCVNGCQGHLKVRVRDMQNQIVPNAVVSFKYPQLPDFQFAGLTNANGELTFDDLGPPTNGCGTWYSIKVTSPSGGDCGTKQTIIESEGDSDLLIFKCPLAQNAPGLVVQPDNEPVTLPVGQPLNLSATIKDPNQIPVSSALCGVIRPYNQTPLSDTSDAQGRISVTDDSIPVGSHKFQLIASKTGYSSGYGWKNVTVTQQIVRVQVLDATGGLVENATIYDGIIEKGKTNSEGKLEIPVNVPILTLEAKNAGISCGFRTVSPGDQANFICPKSPSLRVNVDTNTGDPAANVLILIDGNIHGMTDLFGTSLRYTAMGPHLVQIAYQFDENGPIYLQEKNANITGLIDTVEFVASIENGVPIELSSADFNFAEIYDIATTIIGVGTRPLFGPVGDYCECQRPYYTEQEFSRNECENLFRGCIENVSVCVNQARQINFRADACIEEKRNIASKTNFIDDLVLGVVFGEIQIPVSVIRGSGSIGPKLTRYLNGGPVDELVESFTKVGQDIWQSNGGRTYNYVVERIPGNENLIVRIKTFNGKIFSAENTSIIENARLGTPLERAAALRTPRLMDTFGELIPGNTRAMIRTLRDAPIDNLTPIQSEGFHRFISLFDAEQGDATIVVFKKTGIWTENEIKEIYTLVKNNADEVIFNRRLPNQPMGGKDVDLFVKLGPKEFWIESSERISRIQGSDEVVGKVFEKAIKFIDETDLDSTIVVRLTQGKSPALTNGMIQEAVANMYVDPAYSFRMSKITRVLIYNAEDSSVIAVVKPS